MSKQVNYNENLCSGAAIRDDKGRRISKLFEASHPKMTVGYAKNLIMPDTPTEQEFNLRQSGGGVIEDGVAVIDKVKGNSVVWNQKFPYDVSKWRGDAGSMTIDGSVITLSCGSSSYVEKMTLDQCIIAGHKYYTRATIVETAGLSRISLSDTDSFIASDAAGTYSSIKVASSNADLKIVNMGGVGQGATFKDVLFVDLTQMFGAGNEPSTVEEFLSRKPKVADEFAYNEGTIVSNKVEAVKAQGRNLATSDILLSTDLSGAEFANASLHRGTYCISLDTPQAITLYVALFDKNGNNISGSASSLGEGWALNSSVVWWYHIIESGGKLSFSLAKDAIVSIKTNVTLSRTTRIMLNVGTTSLPYEPYEEHTLDLSWVKDIKDAEGVKLFEDGIKSAGTAFDEARKDKAVKRVGVVDMGKITWFKRGDISPSMFASSNVAPKSKIGLCPIASINKTTYDATLVDGVLYWMENYVMMYNSKFTTIDDFVNFVSGTPIYYELAEPIEVEYDEKNLTYPVIAGGTEEAIASEPSTAFRADIGYGIDAVKTILDLKARVEALEAK